MSSYIKLSYYHIPNWLQEVLWASPLLGRWNIWRILESPTNELPKGAPEGEASILLDSLRLFEQNLVLTVRVGRGRQSNFGRPSNGRRHGRRHGPSPHCSWSKGVGPASVLSQTFRWRRRLSPRRRGVWHFFAPDPFQLCTAPTRAVHPCQDAGRSLKGRRRCLQSFRKPQLKCDI